MRVSRNLVSLALMAFLPMMTFGHPRYTEDRRQAADGLPNGTAFEYSDYANKYEENAGTVPKRNSAWASESRVPYINDDNKGVSRTDSNAAGGRIVGGEEFQLAAPVDQEEVVVPKRAALLFDQLMVALQKVVDNQQSRGEVGSNSGSGRSRLQLPSASSQYGRSMDAQTMDLQRRGQPKGRYYWRCYFNAVTCFKRK